MVRKIFLGIVLVVVVFIAGFAAFVASRQHLKFVAPDMAVAASTDSTVIARGHYIVRRVTNCAGCHGDTTKSAALLAGEDVPLCGGYVFDIPPGKFYPRNITPDNETGIGTFTDKQLAQALRYGIGHDGRALLPFMELQGLSDEDIVAVISYLRSQRPVHNLVPAHQPNVLGRVVMATVLAKPVGPKEPPLHVSPHGATTENGRYLVEYVALCGSCHTERNRATGQFTGPKFGGARDFENNGKVSWSPPNITADAQTGRLGKLTEDEFVARFRAGRTLPDSPMPWQGFSKMDEDDLRAIYRYLKSVPPVTNDVGPAMAPVAAKKGNG